MGIAGRVHIFRVVSPVFLAHILWVLFQGLFIEISENTDWFFFPFFLKEDGFLFFFLKDDVLPGNTEFIAHLPPVTRSWDSKGECFSPRIPHQHRHNHLSSL